MTTVTYQIPNINCMHCVHTIKTELSELAGVQSVEGWADKKQIKITFDAPATEEKIKAALQEINYPVG